MLLVHAVCADICYSATNVTLFPDELLANVKKTGIQ